MLVVAIGAAPDADDGEPEADEGPVATAVESDDGDAAPTVPGDELDAGDLPDGLACVEADGAVTEGAETLGVETEGAATDGVETAGVEIEGMLPAGVGTAGVEIEGTVTEGVETAGVETDGRPPVASVSALLEVGASAKIACNTSASAEPDISRRNA